MGPGSRSIAVTIFAFALLFGGNALKSQVRPVYSIGAAGLTQLLERVQTTASALHVAAHPDDEDTHFIARLAWGDNARVAYLSLTRGEGGQNILGTELFEALGVIRTEELLQARRLDGGEQFFTRAIDFGFSKTRDEASAKWDERAVLGDMVRVIRRFRPLVIYSRFSGTPADGHGQHQMAGYLTPIAFKAAADPAQFPEQLAEGLRPWQAKKLYRGVGFRPDPSNRPTVNVETGVFDPMLGRYYTEIANEGRSQHKSQEMGVIEMKGPRQSGLIRLDAPGISESHLFDGIDTSVSGVGQLAAIRNQPFKEGLASLQRTIAETLRTFQPRTPAGSLRSIAAALRQTRSLRTLLKTLDEPAAAQAEADFLLAVKEEDLNEALMRAAGVVVDPLAERETLAPGGSVSVLVRSFFSDELPVKVLEVAVDAPRGWAVETSVVEDTNNGDNPFVRFLRETPAHSARFRVTAPLDAPVSQPYYLDDGRDGDRYRWDDSDPKGMSFDAPLLHARVTMEIHGERVIATQPVVHRIGDRVRGELRRNVHVVPRLSVGVDSRLLIVPAGAAPHQQRLVARVTNLLPETAAGTLRLVLPAGWTSAPASVPFSIKAQGDRVSAPFAITAPAGRTPGSYELRAEAVVDGTTYATDLQEIAYPHIQTHRLYATARSVAQVFDVNVAPVHVGYVMGSGDQVPEMIRRLGVTVTLIDDEGLATGDLSRFDTIVIGVRASEARPAFVANHARLLQYVEDGGALVVQYQQNDYVARQLAPYPAQMNSRVADEHAPVTILAGDHPVFTFPNRIGPDDFKGWVQERNLYAFTTFDPRYTPLLETSDPGEPPQRGGQVYARIGKGHYVYTAFAWFRQLPAGVPGAYRQFANLISLPKAPQP